MKPGARIPALLRELADAFDELLGEKPKRRRIRKTAKAEGAPPSDATVDQLRRELRRQGVAA